MGELLPFKPRPDKDPKNLLIQKVAEEINISVVKFLAFSPEQRKRAVEDSIASLRRISSFLPAQEVNSKIKYIFDAAVNAGILTQRERERLLGK